MHVFGVVAQPHSRLVTEESGDAVDQGGVKDVAGGRLPVDLDGDQFGRLDGTGAEGPHRFRQWMRAISTSPLEDIDHGGDHAWSIGFELDLQLAKLLCDFVALIDRYSIVNQLGQE